MLYQLPTQNVTNHEYWQYLIAKGSLTLITSFLISIVAMNLFLKFINAKNICRQPIRAEGPQTHLKEKKNTPTMGGLIIIFSTLISSLLWLDITSEYVIAAIFVLISFAMIGFVDDFMKVTGNNTKGFRGSIKLVLQFAIVSIAILFLQNNNLLYSNTHIQIPFSDIKIELGRLYILFTSLVVVGSANSVNLTDGLDGLVSVPCIIALIALGVISYMIVDVDAVIGNDFQTNLSNITFLCLIMIGAILGFLKYNLKPAKIFMGDVGSLAIGATLGIIAIIVKQELVFFIISLLFVAEALSVIIQVTSYKLCKKRVFLMAPLHHHFEKMGWKETKVVKIFWIVAALFAAVGLTGFLLQ